MVDGSDGAVTELLRGTAAADDASARRALEAARRALLEPGERAVVGRYVLAEQIGAGGLGLVIRAHDPELHRDVAIKLIHPRALSKGGDSARARFIREARSLACLSHPNVVEIYDWGATPEGTLYVVMELVDGVTIDAWLDEASRSPPEILDVFRAAGAGLVAAHDHGLVHRDFKPANVMIGPADRVRVLDFGLARPVSALADDAEEGPTQVGNRRHDHEVQHSITAGPDLLGTPAYMAPEQHHGQPADHRSDQYAFCVALWTALFGAHPFSARTLKGLVANKEGERFQGGSRRAVPRRVRTALRTGLAPDPAHRHASMAALLAKLQRPSRHWWAAAAAAGVGLTAVLAWPQSEAACDDPDAKLVGVWDDAARGSVRDALLETGVPYAEPTARSIQLAMTSYFDEWAAEFRAACEATGRDRRRRLACLDNALAGASARVRILETADAATVEHAAAIVDNTPAPAVCRSRIGAASATIAGQLSEAEAHLTMARLSQARVAAQRAVAAADAQGDLVSVARGKIVEARALAEDSEFVAAKELLDDARFAAMAANRPDVVVEALVHLAVVVGIGMGRFDVAEELINDALARVDRLLGEPRLRSIVLRARGDVHGRQGRYEEALDALQRAYDIQREFLGPAHEETRDTLTALGLHFTQLGRFDEAQRAFAKVGQSAEERFGRHHPDVDSARFHGAIASAMSGDATAALPEFRAALARREEMFGPKHLEVAQALGHLGLALVALERPSEALDPLRRTVALLEELVGREHASTADALNNLGAALSDAGQPEEALEVLQRCLTIREKLFGEWHPLVANTVWTMGQAYVQLGDKRQAVAYVGRAFAVWSTVHRGDMMLAAAKQLVRLTEDERPSGGARR